jgi:D-glycero-alpha-D-manno-heptose 1-phosphate guanylyltransferase
VRRVTAVGERQVVVLAGGLATRLRVLGDDLPKALRPVAGRPFVDLMLESLARQGFRRFHFCLGDHGDRLSHHLEGLEVLEVTVEVEPEPRGTAGALLHSADRLDDTFLLLMGDTYFEFPYAPLFEAMPAAADGLLVVTDAGTEVTPNVALSGRRVVAYDKGGVRAGRTDTGAAVLRRRALDAVGSASSPLDLSALFLSLIERGSLWATVTDRRFFDIGTPERYRALDARLRAETAGSPAC